MKTKYAGIFQITFLFILAMVTVTITDGQSTHRDRRVLRDSKKAKSAFIKIDPSIKKWFDNAYGYVIFPNVGKAGLGVGGAFGNGIVFINNTPIGRANLSQVSIGFQAGAQGYREVIFLENKSNIDDFKENKLKLSAQVSAVLVVLGAAANINYSNGILIFTQPKGGLMYEVSVGGQTFNYEEF
jgi:lipid-binding SYLF domain-containing protein